MITKYVAETVGLKTIEDRLLGNFYDLLRLDNETIAELYFQFFGQEAEWNEEHQLFYIYEVRETNEEPDPNKGGLI